MSTQKELLLDEENTKLKKLLLAQNRELEIETALEKVRSSSLAMHKSDQLREVVKVVFEKLQELDFAIDGGAFIGTPIENSQDINIWIGDQHTEYPSCFRTPVYNAPSITDVLKAHETGLDFFSRTYSFEEKNKWFKYAFEHTDYRALPDKLKSWILEQEYLTQSFAWSKNSGVGIHFHHQRILSENEIDILKRFSKVFEQGYIRFLDLQKAEEQAREAQIEVALEKVRSSSLAMRAAEELGEVVKVIVEKLTELNVVLDANGVVLCTYFNDSKNVLHWIVSPDFSMAGSYLLPYFDHPIFNDAWNSKLAGDEYFSKAFSIEEKNSFFEYAFEHSDYKYFPDEFKQWIFQNDKHTLSFAWQKNSAILIPSHTGIVPTEAEKAILVRFAKVFEQSYVRFMDLQKAEAQAKEAQIELSLERVRAKTMAMHNSNDVGETAAVMEEELKKLGIETIRCGIGIMHEPGDMEVWTISTDENNKTNIIIGWLDMDMHPLLHGAFKSWRNKTESYSYELKGDDLLSYYNAINNYPGYPIRYDTSALPTQIQHNEFHFTEGTLFAFSLQQLTSEQRKIFKRFAGVFGQTYRRYLDLKKAEKSAYESQVEAALERVRSRTLAMQKSDELAETSAVLFKQLINLGIAPNRLYISILKDDEGETEFWITDEDGSKVSMAYEDNLNNNPSFKKMFDGWKQQKKSLVIDMQGEELQQYFQHLSSIHVPFKGGLTQKRRLQYIGYFSKGFIGMASPVEQPKETIDLLERFAYVFNLTFTRFNDLQIAEAHALQAVEDLIKLQTEKRRAEDALTELQAAQKQLVQSEKMASLGELTAGIAHEIQNPLNFVNNFSEVNKELLEELNAERLKPKAERNEQAENEIINDVMDNSGKITYHGKRAGDIVKGMLQHSRISTGVKEPTDINALADEYLRLSYHGLRAKDKSFNATMKTDFDETIGKINIIPQDIGRVLLNLYNNAFYACTEQSRTSTNSAGQTYEPTVSVTTKKFENNVIITVSDNGNGISEKVKDKIFQPFFTTKPTGQGTGLGLSLSYDIVKAHGGEIKWRPRKEEAVHLLFNYLHHKRKFNEKNII